MIFCLWNKRKKRTHTHSLTRRESFFAPIVWQLALVACHSWTCFYIARCTFIHSFIHSHNSHIEPHMFLLYSNEMFEIKPPKLVCCSVTLHCVHCNKPIRKMCRAKEEVFAPLACFSFTFTSIFVALTLLAQSCHFKRKWFITTMFIGEVLFFFFFFVQQWNAQFFSVEHFD